MMTPKEHYLKASEILDEVDCGFEFEKAGGWSPEQYAAFTAMGRLDLERAKLHIELGHSEYLAHDHPDRYV
jgi:hypothetical protein